MRAYYLDRIRIFLTILVIFHHTAIAFGPLEAGIIYRPKRLGICPNAAFILYDNRPGIFYELLLPHFGAFNACFVRKKGFGQFVKDRLVRLGIPLIVYICTYSPYTSYGLFWIIPARKISGPAGMASDKPRAGSGPMWFVLTLLIFELLYALYIKFRRNRNSGQSITRPLKF
jgi:hypothetical protein